jgi:predicted  nucleic acid-binding Zn-ribbon protein
MWRCSSCGYVWEGDEPPDECPKCGSAAARYAQIDAKVADLIDKSRFTNSLHMQLYALLEQVMEVAEDGMDENLDSACVEVFQQARDLAEILQQSIKAELQEHVNKGKWG